MSLSIVGVYMPTTDYPVDIYMEYITELENILSTLQAYGPTVVMGDFNAHLAVSSRNGRGQLVENMCSHLDMYPVSLSELHSGPDYTFF